MSNQSFTRAVVKGVVKNTQIGTKGSKGQERTIGEVGRSLLTTKFVQQCLVLNQEVLTDLVWAYNQSVDNPIKTRTIPKYKTDLVTYVKRKSAEPKLKTSAGKQFDKLRKSAGLEWGVDVFYIPTTFKGVRDVIQEFNEQFSEDYERTFDQSKFGGLINYDHGGDGVPSGLMGAAIGTESVRQNAKGTKDAPLRRGRNKKEFNQKFKANLSSILNKGLNSVADKGKLKKTLLKLQMESHQLVDGQNGLVAGMSMLVTPKLKGVNLDQASEEAQIQAAYTEAYRRTISPNDLVNMEGSSTMLQKIAQLMVDNTVVKVSKNKNTRVKRPARVANRTRSRGKADEPQSKGVKVRKLSGATFSRGSKKVTAKSQSGGVSPFSYLAMINKKLPQTVRKNMGAPALENISGRFANSVKVESVAQTQQGYPSFGYSYAKEPYQVFEVGSSGNWSSTQRDPRKLIDRSIREVAAEFALGRFYTRRL